MAYQIKKDPISKIPKVQLAFWLLVRLAMLICAGYSFIHGDTVMGFEILLYLHPFVGSVPDLRQRLVY